MEKNDCRGLANVSEENLEGIQKFFKEDSLKFARMWEMPKNLHDALKRQSARSDPIVRSLSSQKLCSTCDMRHKKNDCEFEKTLQEGMQRPQDARFWLHLDKIEQPEWLQYLTAQQKDSLKETQMETVDNSEDANSEQGSENNEHSRESSEQSSKNSEYNLNCSLQSESEEMLVDEMSKKEEEDLIFKLENKANCSWCLKKLLFSLDAHPKRVCCQTCDQVEYCNRECCRQHATVHLRSCMKLKSLSDFDGTGRKRSIMRKSFHDTEYFKKLTMNNSQYRKVFDDEEGQSDEEMMNEDEEQTMRNLEAQKLSEKRLKEAEMLEQNTRKLEEDIANDKQRVKELKEREAINAKLKERLANEVTEDEILRLFAKNKEYLQQIKDGKIYSSRHEAFNKSRKTRHELAYKVIFDPFTDGKCFYSNPKLRCVFSCASCFLFVFLFFCPIGPTVHTQTHKPDQTKINIKGFDMAKSAAQLLYAPVLVLDQYDWTLREISKTWMSTTEDRFDN